MMLLAVLAASGLVLFSVILMARAIEGHEWARSLVRLRLDLPRELSSQEVAAWLGQIGASTVPPRFALLQAWPISLEIEATSRGITHTVLVPRSRRVALLASLRASLPGVRITEVSTPEQPVRFGAGVELRLTSQTAPLGDDRAATAANGVLAALQPLPAGAVVRLQWLFAGVRG